MPSSSPRAIVSTVAFTVILSLTSLANADWTTWRGGSERGGSTEERLPSELSLRWSRAYPALEPAWSEDARLQFDAHYEPVVVGKKLLLSSSRNNSVTGMDVETGVEAWQFFADGPVRLAPVVWQGKTYFGSDDGFFYSLNHENGTLRWKFRAAPSERHAVGNGRLTSVWPVRGGPVVVGDKLYFTAGVWPFEGTLLYAIDLGHDDKDGQVPPFTATSLPDFAPQGYLAATDQHLFIPGGRANALCIDLQSGKRVNVKYDARGTTDCYVTASQKWMFHGGKIVDVEAGRTMPLAAARPVAADGKIYFANKGIAQAYDLKNQQTVDAKDRRGKPIKLQVPRLLWRLADQPVTRVHAKAGNRLYAHHKNMILAIDLPISDGPAKVSWKAEVDGTPATMLVAEGKLIVVTKEGTISCFGAGNSEPKHYTSAPAALAAGDASSSARAEAMLKEASQTDGYGVVVGIGKGKLVEELLRQSQLQLIVVDPDPAKVADLRRRVDDAGLYGTRLTAYATDPLEFQLPPYLANLVVVNDELVAAADDTNNTQLARRLFAALRPYGGTALFSYHEKTHKRLGEVVKKEELPAAEFKRSGYLSVLSRPGALPGAADWTHEYGDPANTLMSKDKMVKAPLGVLWFGGPSSDGNLFYDRHDWGPSAAVIEGRMFLQGPQKLTAVDVYTGRLLWQIPLASGNSPGRRANWSPTGYHFVAVQDAIYLAYRDQCLRLDPKTGKRKGVFQLPEKDSQWGRIRVLDNLLLVPVFRSVDGRANLPTQLIAMDRHNGKIRWTKDAAQSFAMLAVGDEQLFCVDGFLEGLYRGADKRRKGGNPQADDETSIRAFELKTGKELWSHVSARVPSWIAYSQEHDVVVTSNKSGLDACKGKDGAELWTKQAVGQGFRGHPENYYGRVILWKDQVIDQRGPGRAYNVATGEPIRRTDPITGESLPWEFTKIGHHCNYAIANEHLLTFRAADAGFCDLETGGTGRLTGFRSGCRNSLIPANGVLNAPNMAHGCVCGFSIFTSLALVNVPKANLWTYGSYKPLSGQVERLGINFGAAGDRRDEEGTLWLDYPNAGGPSPGVNIQVSADAPQWFRSHVADMNGDGWPWVTASGVRGIKSVTVPLVFGKGQDAAPERTYTVRLYFATVDETAADINVFDVDVQGQPALKNFDVANETKAASYGIIKEVTGVKAARTLSIKFTPKKGLASICGVEVIRQQD